jgi:hypothetical protein
MADFLATLLAKFTAALIEDLFARLVRAVFRTVLIISPPTDEGESTGLATAFAMYYPSQVH